MTQHLYTPQEFADKCDWEGGLLETVFGYGLGPDDIDLNSPDGPALASLLAKLLAVSPIVDQILALLPEPGGDE